MARSVTPWKGKTDDTAAPPRVRDRVGDAKGWRCHMCGRVINPNAEAWTSEHLVAIINGGENAEHNLGLTCSICLPVKNAADIALKSQTAAKRKKARGIKTCKGRPLMGTVASGWKKPFYGPAVRR